MKGKRFTDEQIAYALRQAEGGTPVADVCRQLGVSEASFYLWKNEVRQARADRDPGTATAAR
jgi:putative transposase